MEKRKLLAILVLTLLCLNVLALLPLNFSLKIVKATSENFTTWTEDGADADGILTQTSTRSTWSSMERQDEVYLYKSYGAGHFGTFDVIFDLRFTSVEAGDADSRQINNLLVFTDTVGAFPELPSDALCVLTRQYSADDNVFLLSAREVGGTPDNGDFQFSAGTTYYLRVKRSDTTFTCDAYSSSSDRSSETGALEQLSATVSSGTTFEYLECPASSNSTTDGTDYSSGYIENLDLQEAEDTSPPQHQNAGPSNGTEITENGEINLTAQGRDETGLDQAWLSTNETGTWKNYTSNYVAWNYNFTEGEEEFDYPWNSPVFIHEPNSSYPYKLLIFDPPATDTWSFWQSTNATSGYEWVSNFTGASDQESPQVCRINASGYYYYYSSYSDSYARLFIAPPDNWTDVSLFESGLTNNKIGDFPDCGVFYDPENDTWHLYYQIGVGASTPNIGWATSPNGRTDWTDHGQIINAPFNTGDAEVIQIDETYYMFVDHHHDGGPAYSIALYYGLDLENWTLLDSNITTHTGGDAKPLWIAEENEFIMYVEFWDGLDCSVGWMHCPYHINGAQYIIDPDYNRMDIYKTEFHYPIEMNSTPNTWFWSNFTWSNSSISAGTQVQWQIWYNDTSGNVNSTDIRYFNVVSGGGEPYYVPPDLHVQDYQILDSDNNPVVLHGVNKGGYNNYPVGRWQAEGENFNDYNATHYFREPAVNWQLNILANNWSINTMRWTITCSWWEDNYGYNGSENSGYRYWIRRGIEIADTYGIQIIFAPWRVTNTSGQTPPLDVWTKAHYVNFYHNVSQELRNCSNVIFDLFNEPTQATNTTKSTWQDLCQAILNDFNESGIEHLVLYQWGYGCGANGVGGGESLVQWYNNYPLYNYSNLVIQTHTYGASQGYSGWTNQSDYASMKADMSASSADYDGVSAPVGEGGLYMPLLIGECGGNSSEGDFFNVTLRIFNEWDYGYLGWILAPTGLSALNLLGSEPYFPDPSDRGQILIDRIEAYGAGDGDGNITNPYHEWRFEGNLTDTGGYSTLYDMASGGTGAQYTNSCHSNLGQALDLNGSNYVYNSTLLDDINTRFGSTGFTITLWLNASTCASGTTAFIDKQTTSNDGFYLMSKGTARKILFYVKVNGTIVNLESDYAFQNKQWIHIVATLASDGTMTLYCNNVRIASDDTLTGIPADADGSETNFTIGYTITSDRYYVAPIDEVRIYSGSLTEHQRSELFYEGVEPIAGQNWTLRCNALIRDRTIDLDRSIVFLNTETDGTQQEKYIFENMTITLNGSIWQGASGYTSEVQMHDVTIYFNKTSGDATFGGGDKWKWINYTNLKVSNVSGTTFKGVSCSYVTQSLYIKGLTIQGANHRAIDLIGASASNLHIEDVYISEGDGIGIYCSGAVDNGYFENITIYNMRGTYPAHGISLDGDADGNRFYDLNITITGNVTAASANFVVINGDNNYFQDCVMYGWSGSSDVPHKAFQLIETANNNTIKNADIKWCGNGIYVNTPAPAVNYVYNVTVHHNPSNNADAIDSDKNGTLWVFDSHLYECVHGLSVEADITFKLVNSVIDCRDWGEESSYAGDIYPVSGTVYLYNTEFETVATRSPVGTDFDLYQIWNFTIINVNVTLHTHLDQKGGAGDPQTGANINVTLQNATYVTDLLALNVYAPSGTNSSTEVYCGSKGEPTNVTGATSYSYNNSTSILTVNVTHASSQQIIVSWEEQAETPTGGSGGGGTSKPVAPIVTRNLGLIILFIVVLIVYVKTKK